MITAYMFLSNFDYGPGGDINRYYKVRGLYTNKNQLMEIARSAKTNMFTKEEEIFQQLNIYEKEAELPDRIEGQIYPDTGSDKKLPLPILSKKENQVFAIILNADGAEGRGPEYFGAFTTDILLANKIAWGNGVCGSNADVIVLTLNKNMRKDIRLIRTKKGEVKNW